MESRRDPGPTNVGSWERHKELCRQVLQNRICADSTVLEIGCGENPFGELPRMILGTKIAVDVEPALLRQLHLRDKGLGTRLLAADATSLPFRDATLDGIVAIWVVEHLENPGCFLAEARRVLRLGGFVFFLTPNLANPLYFPIRLAPVRFRERILRRVGGHPEHGYLTFLRANNIRRLTTLARESGFDLVSTDFLWEEGYLLRVPAGPFLLQTLGRWTLDTHLEDFAGRLYALLVRTT